MARRGVCHQATAQVAGHEIPYVLCRVPRRKHIHLVITDNAELEVRGPWHCSKRYAEELIAEHQDWVLPALNKARGRKRVRPRLVSGAQLPLLDEQLKLALHLDHQLDLFDSDPRDGWQGRVVRRGNLLKVHSPDASEPVIRALVERWYREEAARALPQRLHAYAHQLGLKPSRVSVRAQKTQWGSCSSLGSITLNWRLVLVPGELTDYVLVHELCHLKHLDHSPAFWRAMERAMPDYAERRTRLDTLQDQLVL